MTVTCWAESAVLHWSTQGVTINGYMEVMTMGCAWLCEDGRPRVVNGLPIGLVAGVACFEASGLGYTKN
jgi:hypothetical protein